MKVEWTDELRAKAAELLRLLVKEENGILFARRNKHTRWRPVTAFTGWSADARSVSAAVARWCGYSVSRWSSYLNALTDVAHDLNGPAGHMIRSGSPAGFARHITIDQATPEQRLYALAKAALESE